MQLLTVPTKCKTLEMLLGTIEKLDNLKNIVTLIEDDEGVWLMTIDGTTLERMNWMLDRAKLIIHDK